jgi:DNA repair protein RadD
MRDISTVEGLRYYQKDALESVISAIKKGLDGNYLLVLPTAAGKSFLVSSMAHVINKPVLILQPTKEILQQNYEKLLKYVDPKDIGIYSASMNEKTIRMFTFATIQSVYKKADFFKHFDYFILDESHYLNPSNLTGMFTTFINGTNKLRKELMRRPPIKIIGLTATPYRMETAYKFDKKNNEMIAYTTIKLINRMKGRFWKHLLYNINMQELMDKGFLCSLNYIDKTLIEHMDIPLNKSMSDFNLEMYEKKLSKKQTEIIKIINYAESISKSLLIFCSSVSQAEILSTKIKESVVVTAKTKSEERDTIVKKFKSGKIKTVLNVGVFVCGFDHPALDCIVLLRPTRSIGLLLQMLGRGVRIAPEKKDCKIIDVTSTIKNIGRIETVKLEKQDTWELISEKGSWHNREIYRFKLGK